MVRYATRTEVTTPLDIRPSALMAPRVDRALESASRDVETLCNRRTGFYPTIATRTFDYPNTQNAISGRLWLDGTPLISLTSMTSGGVAVPPANVFARPDIGPPYSYIELDRSMSSALSGGTTAQRALSLTGVWGFSNTETVVGTLTAGVGSSALSLAVSAPVDVGALLRIDSERLEVTEASWAASTETLTASIAADVSAEVLTVSSTTGYVPYETVLIDAERFFVTDVVSATQLNVKRSWDGTTLAAHSNGAAVRRQLALTVTRGAAGTAAASHSLAAAVQRWTPPPLVRDLTIAYAQDRILQEGSGYLRLAQGGDGRALGVSASANIANLEKRVYAAYGRKARHRAV